MKWKFVSIITTLTLCTLFGLTTAIAPASAQSREFFSNDRLLERSKHYSDAAVRDKPELGLLLRSQGLKYLHELDPKVVYSIDLQSGRVTLNRETPRDGDMMAGPTGIFWGFGSPTVLIASGGATSLIGQAATTVTCPFSAQTAEVSGFMASTVSRDPLAGIRNGILVVDTPLSSKSQADFNILKVSGGARNPMNRTVLESTHVGTCGSEVRVQNLVSTWPPARVELAIDDTGSMGTQLSGVKTALANFVGSNNTGERQRETSYELISFKDGPTLQLANTSDTSAALSAINALTASGGGDCPEDAYGAVSMALNGLESDQESEGSIILATDASPQGGISLDSLIARAQATGTRVHVLLSGDCVSTAAAGRTKAVAGNSATASATTESSRLSFSRLAEETGGLYFYMPGATAADYAATLEDIFESVVAGIDVLESGTPVTGLEGAAAAAHLYRIEVPSGVSQLEILSYGGTGNVTLQSRYGSVPSAATYDNISQRPGNNEVIRINAPVAGTYYIRLVGVTNFAGVTLRGRAIP